MTSARDAGRVVGMLLLVHLVTGLSAWKWAHYSHLLVAVGWIFTLYSLLFRFALVPRAIAAIGMVTSLLQITGITLPVFLGYRMPSPELFGMPLGVACVTLALWLLARGFRGPRVAAAVA